MAIKSCNSFLEKKQAIHAWYTFKSLLTWLSPWTVVFLWIHLLMGESVSHCLQPPVILLQIPDTPLRHSYCILKGKDLPQLLRAKISWVSLTWWFKLSQSLWVLILLRPVLSKISIALWLLQLGVWCFTCKIKVVATVVFTLTKNISQHSSSFLLCAVNTAAEETPLHCH